MRKFILLVIDKAILLLVAIILLPFALLIWLGVLLWRWYRRMELDAFYGGDAARRDKEEWKDGR